MENYLYIGKDNCNNYVIRAEYDGKRFRHMTYIWYSKRNAIKAYRQQFNLERKRFITIDFTK